MGKSEARHRVNFSLFFNEQSIDNGLLVDRRVERDWTVDELIGELWAELSWERQVPEILLLAISAAMHDRYFRFWRHM